MRTKFAREIRFGIIAALKDVRDLKAGIKDMATLPSNAPPTLFNRAYLDTMDKHVYWHRCEFYEKSAYVYKATPEKINEFRDDLDI